MDPLTADYETNNCHLVKYSDIIQLDDTHLKIPFRTYELYLVDIFDIHQVKYEIVDDYIISSDITRADIYNFINENYYFDQYWDYVQDLSMPSKLFRMTPLLARYFTTETDDIPIPDELIHIFRLAISTYDKTFLRLNSVSPHLDEYISDPVEIINRWKKNPRITNTIRTMLEYDTEIFLVARQWMEIEPEMEFRCFVYKGTLTAISQYYLLDIAEPEKIKNLICQWWKSNREAIPYEDCVMDLCIVDEKVLVIEFGPFGIDLNAGSCTYNWLSDYHILYNWKAEIPDIR